MSIITITFVDAAPLTFVTNSYDFVGGFFTIIQGQGNTQVTTAFPASSIISIVINSQT